MFKKNNIKNNILIYILIFIAFFLRFRPILTRPIIFDESFTVTYLINFPKVIDLIHHDASIPPLHYLLIKFISIFSTKLFWLRLPSLIYSVLSLIIIYKWLKPHSKRMAIFTLTLLTFSTFQITYAWQAYVYGQLFLFSLLSIYFFYISFYQKGNNFFTLMGFIFFSIAAWFTHYGYIWTLLGIGIFILVSIIKVKFNLNLFDKGKKHTIFSFFIVILFLVMYLPIFIDKFKVALDIISWMDKLNPFAIGKSLLNLSGLDSHSGDDYLDKKIIYILFIIIFLSFYLFYFILKNKIKPKLRSLFYYLILLLSTNIVMPIIVSIMLKQSIFAERSLIICTFLISSISALIIEYYSNKKRFLFIVGLFFLLIYILYTRKIDKNHKKYIFQHQEAAKYYIEWFRINTEAKNKTLNILSFDSQAQYPRIDTNNFCSIDYYWYGYDGNEKLYKYKRITPENFYEYKNREFYILIMHNPQNLDIHNETQICTNPKFMFEAQKGSGLSIYKCN